MSRLLLVRHGQASYLAADYDKLSPLGEEQSRCLGEAMRGERPTRVFHGPRKRQRDTCSLARSDGWPEATELRDLDEHEVGTLFPDHVPALLRDAPEVAAIAMEYVSTDEPAKKERAADRLLREALHAWRRGVPAVSHIESFDAFRARSKRALDALTDAPSGSLVVAFSSGGLIAAVLSHVLSSSEDAAIELGLVMRNASVSEVRFSEGRVSVFSVNDVGHLPADAHTFR